jgi:hypothetical protein
MREARMKMLDRNDCPDNTRMPTEADLDRFTDEAYERREQEQYRVSVILDNIKKASKA